MWNHTLKFGISWALTLCSCHLCKNCFSFVGVIYYVKDFVWPVVVLLAVDIVLLDEAGAVGAEGDFALAALEAARVPLLVDGQQEEAVLDAAAAAVARLVAAGALQGALVLVLQHRARVPEALTSCPPHPHPPCASITHPGPIYWTQKSPTVIFMLYACIVGI